MVVCFLSIIHVKHLLNLCKNVIIVMKIAIVVCTIILDFINMLIL